MFKKIFKRITIAILTFEARLILRRYGPKIIAITGNVGKTSAKDAVYAVLAGKFSARKSAKSYNSEFGVPLTIIGSETGWLSFFKWIRIIFQGLKPIVKKIKYPDFLILEIGADRPGDIEKISRWLRPHAAIVTPIGEVPVHIEFFAGPEMLAREKAKLLQNISPENYVILNFDDDTVLAMKEKTKANILTYGVGEGADVIGSNYRVTYKEGSEPMMPEGISFKADYKGNSIPVRIFETFGKQQMYAALGAMAFGISQGLNLIEMSEALSLYKSPPGRLKLIEGIKNTWILDDSYNASPAAMHAALDLLAEITAQRKIAVLGDMLELGKYTIDAHKAVGQKVAPLVQMLFVVGPRSKFITEEARAKGFPVDNIFEFSDSEKAARMVETKIEQGDLILVKGSQSMRMEKIVEAIMARPEKKEELLVRQEKYWQENP